MILYILFQTDLERAKRRRICYGVYSSEEKAKTAANEMGLYDGAYEVEIIVTALDQLIEA